MKRSKRFIVSLLVGVVLAGICSSPVWAGESETKKTEADKTNWLSAAGKDAEKTKKLEIPAEDVKAKSGWKKPIPVTFSIDYTLVTDYIFRGINFSEYRRKWGQSRNEGREKLNHQLGTGVELDLNKFGRIGGSVWFEWYAGQSVLTPEDGHNNLQEIDYTVYYGYNIEQIGLDVEGGFIWYVFPRGDGDGRSTQEIYLNLSFDDSVLWRAIGWDVKNPILNPYLNTAWDMDLAKGGSYQEFGISHDFALADFGAGEMPILKDVTVTPSWSMGWHHNWLNKFTVDPHYGDGWKRRSNTSGIVNMVWGLNVGCDLKNALSLPDIICGDLTLNGFLNYSQGVSNHFVSDEFWGGMNVAYAW
ncbi:MAG: hypothetical protein K8S55_06425 [Phycisphaerae bacterium]|nr:hypothetical protein [Phycisphaerae bacterium]